MVYGLARLGSAVDHQPVTTGGNSLLVGNLVGDLEEPAEQQRIVDVADGVVVALGKDEHVYGGLRIQVLDGHHVIVLMDPPGLDLAGRDPAEDAGFQPASKDTVGGATDPGSGPGFGPQAAGWNTTSSNPPGRRPKAGASTWM